MTDDSILNAIVSQKKKELADRKKALSPQALLPLVRGLPETRGLVRAIREATRRPAAIAELKKTSHTGDLLGADFQPESLARELAELGAAALCVVTEKRFGGDLATVRQLSGLTELPILMRDYVIDPYQLYEARYLGADAVVLRAGILSNRDLADFNRYAGLLGLDLLVEVRTREEMGHVVSLGFPLIGIDNRDPHTFVADLGMTVTLLQHEALAGLERPLIASVGGITRREEVEQLRGLGIDAVLVGEPLMGSANLAGAYHSLFG